MSRVRSTPRTEFATVTLAGWILSSCGVIGLAIYWSLFGIRFVFVERDLALSVGSALGSVVVAWLTAYSIGRVLRLDFRARRAELTTRCLKWWVLSRKSYRFSEIRSVRRSAGGWDSLPHVHFTFGDGDEFACEQRTGDEVDRLRERLDDRDPPRRRRRE